MLIVNLSSAKTPKTGKQGEIHVITRIVKGETDASLSHNDMQTVMAEFTKSVNSHWSQKYKILVHDRLCVDTKLSVHFHLQYGDTIANPHAKMNFKLLSAFNRSIGTRANVSGDDVTMFPNDFIGQGAKPRWTFAHEYGHLVGLTDEYKVDGIVNKLVSRSKITYYLPDPANNGNGRLKVPIKAESRNNIMTSHGSVIVEKYHYAQVVWEVQKLLRSKLGGHIWCEIV